MTILTVDQAVLAALKQARGPAEIRDADGNLLGYFTPARPTGLFPTTRATEADLPELDRLAAAALPGKTTREVFEYLKTLTNDPTDLADLQRHIDELAEE